MQRRRVWRRLKKNLSSSGETDAIAHRRRRQNRHKNDNKFNFDVIFVLFALITFERRKTKEERKMSRQSLGLVHDNALINASLWTLFRVEIHYEDLRTINFQTCFTINHSRGFLNSAVGTTSDNSPSGSVCSCARITTWKLMSRGKEKCFHKNLFGQRKRVWCENSFKCFAFTPSAIRNYVKGLKFIVSMNWMRSKVKMKHSVKNGTELFLWKYLFKPLS